MASFGNYLLITPVFNEEDHLNRYLDSIIDQNLKPRLFILVDDNSTDRSKEIILDYSRKYNWIKYSYHVSQPKKVQGSKVIEAFNFGLDNLDLNSYDFISKIDADIELPQDYFQTINEHFNENSRLGICGGKIEELRNDIWEKKWQADYHVRGALKSYRISCFNEMDGILPVLGWDGIDEIKAMYLGWDVLSIDKYAKHFRNASSDYRPIKMQFKYGIAAYRNGNNLFLTLIRTIVKSIQKPFILSGISFFVGYLYSFIRRDHKNVEKTLAKYINKFHLKRLLKLKR